MARTGRPGNGGLASKSGWIGSVARFWTASCLLKNLCTRLCWLRVAVDSLLLGNATVPVKPFHRMFFINNIDIQYPHALQERVPVTWNLIYAGAIPCATLALWLGISKANLHKWHVTMLGFFIGLILTSFITDVIKNAVGRPRPDLISRCKPVPGTPDNKLVTIDVCTETDPHTLQDGWRSFPSGHSSFAFAGLGFLALFISGQTHVFRPRTDLGRVLLALAPLLGAAMIAISRCEDYRHDVYDVTCGSILGIGVTYFSYRRYFPKLHSSKCHEPYPSRETIFNQGFGKVKNDEEAEVGAAREFDLSDNDSEA
ncbi:pap2 domain protein [Rutstroemia sp. NJR-2017a BBW]|nr:pap2 domain protein [Rutstroemia sp. NJR-2017a BBW]